MSNFEAMKAATCQINGPGARGTGYLVSGNRIVTCYHVIKQAAVGQPVAVTFPGHKTSQALVTDKRDEQWDVAVLEWRDPVSDIVPLRFGNATERKMVWEGYGYPGVASDSGLPIDGTVDDLAGKDTRGVVSFVLTAGKLEAGTGAPPHGYSGSPVVLNGLVVGHLKRILEDPDNPRHVAFGTVYAARAKDFLALLPGETLHEAVSVHQIPVATNPIDGYEVFLSASAADLPRANQLVEALRDRGRRVFFPLADIAPGQNFTVAVDAALARSRAGVVLFTPRWIQESRLEGDALWTHRGAVTFPLVPVLSDGMRDALPPPWDDLRPIDLRRKDLTGPAFERLLYALDGKTAPYEIVAADMADMLKRDDDPQVTAANAKRLIAIGNPRKALEILAADTPDLPCRRLRALALSKSGRTDDAIEILKTIQTAGKLDAETAGILGGCYRRKFETTKQVAFLKLALGVYLDAFDRFGDPYPGINTASILLQLGDKEGAREVALKVLDGAQRVPDAAADHWTAATLGEAHLIQGDLGAARDAYQRAVLQGLQFAQDIAVMRRGARRALRALDRNPGDLDDVFSVPRPVAFVGHGIDLPGQQKVRFPRNSVGAISHAIRDVLDRHNSLFGIASATVGGDTIFIDEILARDGLARVVLPCAEGTFLDYFVAQPERKYEVRKIFKHPRVEIIVVEDPTDPADVWSDFGPRLRDYAKEWADTLDEKPLLLALWDKQPSFLESVIDLWRDRDWEVEILPLRDGQIGL
jgi:tetratricopeptide (TPR) repeat protein